MTLSTFLKMTGLAVCLTAASGTAAAAQQAKKEFITIGTGSVTGVYYPAGGGICRLVNSSKDNQVRCNIESTGGSVYNINAIRSGELDFGIVQSDWQYHAYKGTGEFAALGPMPNLRVLFSLQTEPFNVVARKDAGITNISDLKGKRVNIGEPGSGDRATMEVVMKAMGWDKSTFKLAAELKGSERSQALCDNMIDAFVYVVGHPNGSIKEATTTCDAGLVNVSGPQIDNLMKNNSYYTKTVVPKGTYAGTDDNTVSFGVTTTLVATTAVPDDVAYAMTKAVFENFDTFKRLHPAFANLRKEDMVKAGISIPLHPGAMRYYKEVGLIRG